MTKNTQINSNKKVIFESNTDSSAITIKSIECPQISIVVQHKNNQSAAVLPLHMSAFVLSKRELIALFQVITAARLYLDKLEKMI